MSKYAFAYLGGSGMATTEEERDAAMAAWGAWFGELGSAVVDPGNPFAASTSVASDGSVNGGARAGLGGYSVVEAASLEDAAALVKGCPVLAGGGSVDVYEIVPVM
jgi:hypothetical protein